MNKKDINLLAEAYNTLSLESDVKRDWNAEYKEMEQKHGGGVDWATVEIDGIDTRDYPDFSDAYITGIDFIDGTPVPDDYVDVVQDLYSDIFYDKVMWAAQG